ARAIGICVCLMAMATTTCCRSFCPGPPGLRCRSAPPSAARRTQRRALGDDAVLWVPDSRLVKSIEKLGGRVTKADLASAGAQAAGLERELLQLARASGATLRVNDRGELLFDFPADLAIALRKSSRGAQLQQAWTKVSPWLSYGGRVLFGVSLLAMVVVLYSAVVILLTANASKNDNSSRSGGTSISMNMWFGSDIFWWILPRPYGYYRYETYGLYGSPQGPPKMSFFESVFSFVFGDGDPNTRLLTETRWQLIAETIAQNGGSVVADQLAPFLDAPSELYAEDQRSLDKAVLPALLRFRGRPEVSEDGTIVYVFPELQESRAAGELIVGNLSTREMKKQIAALGAKSKAVERSDIVADYRRATEAWKRRNPSSLAFLPEQELKFSEASNDQLLGCVGLGAFSLLAALFLGTQILNGHAQILARYHPVMRLVTRGYPLLLGYVVAFLGIPTWRWLRLRRENKRIQKDNAWRKKQAEKLQGPEGGIRARIASAARWAAQKLSFGQPIYDSSETASGKEEQDQAQELKSFDKRLESLADNLKG
ncbi:unnamed protein product, partial [Polarella glacialis]